jgi:hypothetical protein
MLRRTRQRLPFSCPNAKTMQSLHGGLMRLRARLAIACGCMFAYVCMPLHVCLAFTCSWEHMVMCSTHHFHHGGMLASLMRNPAGSRSSLGFRRARVVGTLQVLDMAASRGTDRCRSSGLADTYRFSYHEVVLQSRLNTSLSIWDSAPTKMGSKTDHIHWQRQQGLIARQGSGSAVWQTSKLVGQQCDTRCRCGPGSQAAITCQLSAKSH